MREIVFRGRYIQRCLQKHASTNAKWVYGSLILRDDYCCILEPPNETNAMDYPYLDGDLGTIDGYATPVDPDTVGQFTGIYDKNGTPVYEGDILGNHFFDEDNGHGVVTYNDGAFEISNPIKTVTFHENLWGKDVEIIGNIYDNPELIGGDEE